MVNEKQLFHEMLGGEQILSLRDPTIPLAWKFLLVSRRFQVGSGGRGEGEGGHARNFMTAI